VTVKQLRRLKETSLMLAMFFLPFGYDAIFALILKYTNSYWLTDGVFYIISGLFFMSYFLLTRYLTSKDEQ
jgi:hypothetical protein